MIRVLAITSILLPLYFLPAILGRGKQGGVSIFVLDLLFGWTVIGWIVALVWAVSPLAHFLRHFLCKTSGRMW